MNNLEIDQLGKFIGKKIQDDIRNYMRQRNISPSKLAKIMNKKRSTISTWLRTSNGHNFSLDTLVEIQAILGITIFKHEISKESKYEDTKIMYNNTIPYERKKIDRFL